MKPSHESSFATFKPLSNLPSLAKKLAGSELLLDRGSWNIVDTIWLLDAFIAWHLSANSWNLAITNKGHSTTAVGSLPGHRVDTHYHGNDSTIQQKETKDTDSDDNIEKNLVCWLPLDVTILVNLAWHASCTRGNQNHNELNQKRPCGHVHAVLAPTLRRALAVSEHQCTHAGAYEQDGQ